MPHLLSRTAKRLHLSVFVLGLICLFLARKHLTVMNLLLAFPISGVFAASYFWIRVDAMRTSEGINKISESNELTRADLIARGIDSKAAIVLLAIAALAQTILTWPNYPFLSPAILFLIVPFVNYFARMAEHQEVNQIRKYGFLSSQSPIDSEVRLLTIDEVISRLQIDNEDVIETIYSIYYDSLEKEDKRRSDLDHKADSFIGIVGMCITLIFGLGGLLIEKINNQGYVVGITILYVIAFLFGASSLFFALLAARARSDFRTINEQDVFHKNQIKQDVLAYKRYLIAHYWRIQRADYQINENKGIWLKRSFWMFLGMIVFLILIVSVIARYLLTRGGL